MLATKSSLPGPRVTSSPWLVAGCYLLLTWVFWGRFVLDRGLHGETIWIELSQTRPWWQGFFYPYDASRRFMSLPFHLAYLLSDGSYLSLHVLFGVFVWLTGFLTYLLVKNFLPEAEFLSFAAGAIALTHGGDGSINAVSMIVVRQAVVCILIAVLVFRMAWRTRRPALLILVALAQGVSLWTYEPGLLPLLFGPVLIYQKRGSLRRFAFWSAAWSIVPMLTVASLLYRYLFAGQVSYQSAKLASHWSFAGAMMRLWGMVVNGLAFWRWPGEWSRLMQGCASIIQQQITVPLVFGVMGFVACALFIGRRNTALRGEVSSRPVLMVVSVYLLLSYLPFLLLAESALQGKHVVSFYRAQFYAAVPAAVLLAVAACSIDRRLHGRSLVAVALCTIVVASGLWSGLVSQLEMSRKWALYRKVMLAIVDAAPRIRDDSFVALVNVPTTRFYSICEGARPSDPFSGDTMWFNSALQVFYPNTRLVGIYWRGDGVSPGSIQFTFDSQGTRLERTNVTVKGEVFGYDQMIAFEYDSRKGAVLLRSLPWARIPGSVNSHTYDPMKRILPGPAPKETLRRLATGSPA